MPPSIAAPNAEPSSTDMRQTGTPSTDAQMRSQRSLRAPPPEARADGRRRTPSAREQVERVGEAEGDALEHGAHDVRRACGSRSARRARARASGSACGVRSPVR